MTVMKRELLSGLSCLLGLHMNKQNTNRCTILYCNDCEFL